MKENIFDLQVEISNLIKKHNLEKGEYAFIYRNETLMIVDLSQIKLEETSQKKDILQEEK